MVLSGKTRYNNTLINRGNTCGGVGKSGVPSSIGRPMYSLSRSQLYRVQQKIEKECKREILVHEVTRKRGRVRIG